MRRFDEVLLDKASKVNIEELLHSLSKYTPRADFLVFQGDVLSQISSNSLKTTSLEDLIDLLGKNISKDIYAAVRKATQHLQAKAETTTTTGDSG